MCFIQPELFDFYGIFFWKIKSNLLDFRPTSHLPLVMLKLSVSMRLYREALIFLPHSSVVCYSVLFPYDSSSHGLESMAWSPSYSHSPVLLSICHQGMGVLFPEDTGAKMPRLGCEGGGTPWNHKQKCQLYPESTLITQWGTAWPNTVLYQHLLWGLF